MTGYLKRFVSLSLCFGFCLAAGFLLEPVALAQGANAAADADASTIRVLLSTDDVTAISFAVCGVYTIEERPDIPQLANGNYRVSNSGGSLTLINTDTGATVVSGLSAITIREHVNPSGTNLIGLYAKDANRKYLGSMKFWPSGAYVDAINHIYLEKYLYGVVANEMGTRFPLEALKAQAVASRSYAYKKLEGSRSKYYDITDSPADQAYSGYTTNSTLIQSVDETSKQVLTYNGSVITAYFAASNGGQTDRTENVWTSSLPYFKIQKDDYDLVKGPSQSVYFPVGTTTDKPEDMPTLPLQPLAIAKTYGASRVTMYKRPDTGSTKALTLKSGSVLWIYEMNSAWVKAKTGNTVGFIPTKYTRIYNLQAIVSSSGRKLLSGPSARSKALLTLPRNAVVTLQSYGTYCVVKYNGTIGYIASKYLKLINHAAPASVTLEAGNTFTVTTRTYLKASARSGSKSLLRLNVGTRVTLISAGSSWHKVSVNGKTGYFPSKYLQLVIPSLVLTSAGYGNEPAPSNNLRYSQDDLDSKLVDFIKTMAIGSLTQANTSQPDGQKYYTSADSIKIKSIIGMSAYQTDKKPYCLHADGSHNASNCPSIDYTGAKMTVMIKVKKENAAKLGGYDNADYTWSFQFYIPDYLKSDKNAQWKVFNSKNNYRIFAVDRGINAGIDCFKLINRRFGHGVGLSQWGAYQRALDTNPAISQYTSILSFYYPGTTLSTLDISQTLLTTLPVETPEPVTQEVQKSPALTQTPLPKNTSIPLAPSHRSNTRMNGLPT